MQSSYCYQTIGIINSRPIKRIFAFVHIHFTSLYITSLHVLIIPRLTGQLVHILIFIIRQSKAAAHSHHPSIQTYIYINKHTNKDSHWSYHIVSYRILSYRILSFQNVSRVYVSRQPSRQCIRYRRRGARVPFGLSIR